MKNVDHKRGKRTVNSGNNPVQQQQQQQQQQLVASILSIINY